MGRAIRMLKDFGATKSDIQHALSGKGGRFQNAGGNVSGSKVLGEIKIKKVLMGILRMVNCM